MHNKEQHTLNDLDLTMQYLQGKITLYRLMKTKEFKGTGQTYIFVCKVLKYFMEREQVEIRLVNLSPKK